MTAISHHMSVAELEHAELPDGRWELIAGELVEMSPTGEEHNDITAGLFLRLGVHVSRRKLGKLVLPNTGIVVPGVPETVRAPDIGFIQAARTSSGVGRRGFIRVVPDFVIEVRSPSDAPGDFPGKGVMWRQAGVALVWLVDPLNATVTELREAAPRVYVPGELLDASPVVPEFRVSVAEVFAPPG